MSGNEYGYTHKTYEQSQRVAANWQCVVAKAGYPTVALELADMTNNVANWNEKFSVHISQRELHSVASVLLGFRQNFETKFHGDNRNKSYSLTRTDAGITLSIHIAGPKKTIHLNPADVFWLASFVVAAVVQNAPPGTPENLIIPMIQRTQ
jgi:hypothetical protein